MLRGSRAHPPLYRFIGTSIGWLYFHQKVYQSLSNYFCLSESIYYFFDNFIKPFVLPTLAFIFAGVRVRAHAAAGAGLEARTGLLVGEDGPA